jgi:RNA polymerase sigma-70 factor (ECF subfamily)
MSTDDRSDAELMISLGAGEDAALDEIMRRYRQPILNFVFRMLGNAADAEEAAQLVFVRVYQHTADYDPGRKFLTWLFALARNAAIDQLRWRKRHATTTLDDAVEPPTTATGATEAARREVGDEIAAAIAALPEDQRTAIVLSEYHGLPDAEIAAVLGCSSKAVESRLYRARRSLRARLRHLLTE